MTLFTPSQHNSSSRTNVKPKAENENSFSFNRQTRFVCICVISCLHDANREDTARGIGSMQRSGRRSRHLK